MADTPSSDDDLIGLARRATGAQNASAIPDATIRSELDAVKDVVQTEVRRTLDSGTIALYDSDAPVEIAKHLLFLRLAEHRRQRRPDAADTPDEKIPRKLGGIRRATFDDPTLRYWRDELVRNSNRLTE